MLYKSKFEFEFEFNHMTPLRFKGLTNAVMPTVMIVWTLEVNTEDYEYLSVVYSVQQLQAVISTAHIG